MNKIWDPFDTTLHQIGLMEVLAYFGILTKSRPWFSDKVTYMWNGAKKNENVLVFIWHKLWKIAPHIRPDETPEYYVILIPLKIVEKDETVTKYSTDEPDITFAPQIVRIDELAVSSIFFAAKDGPCIPILDNVDANNKYK